MPLPNAPQRVDYREIAALSRDQTQRPPGKKLAGLGLILSLAALIASKSWPSTSTTSTQSATTSPYCTTLNGSSLGDLKAKFQETQRFPMDDILTLNAEGPAVLRSIFESCSASIGDTLNFYEIIDSQVHSGLIVAHRSRRKRDVEGLKSSIAQAIVIRSQAGSSLRTCVNQLHEADIILQAEQERAEDSVRKTKRCTRILGCSYKVTNEKALLAAPAQLLRDQIVKLRTSLSVDRDLLWQQSQKIDRLEAQLSSMLLVLTTNLDHISGSFRPLSLFQNPNREVVEEVHDVFLSSIGDLQAGEVGADTIQRQ